MFASQYQTTSLHLNDVVTRDVNSMPTCLQIAAAPNKTCKAMIVALCLVFSVIEVSLISDGMQILKGILI